MLMKTNSIASTSQKLINNYLKKNPNIKEALTIFNISMESYTNAVNSFTNKKIIISTKTTNTNG